MAKTINVDQIVVTIGGKPTTHATSSTLLSVPLNGVRPDATPGRGIVGTSYRIEGTVTKFDPHGLGETVITVANMDD